MRKATAELILKDPDRFAHHDRVFLNNPVVMQGMGLAPLVVLATTAHNGVMLVRMDGFESGSIVPRRYRIEMTNVNEKTGECTLGNLEVFSRSKGWVPGQDPSIARHTASKFPSLSGGAHDLGIAADYFKGCTLKLAKKRDDVLWYPPLEWAKSQTEYDKKIEKMKDTYLHFITDCEALFGL